MASYVPIIVFTSVLLALCQDAFTFQSPENCKWKLQDGNINQIALDCSIRTINSDVDIFKIRSDQSEQITSINVDCSDVLFFQSTLEPRAFQRFYHLQQLDIQFCKLNSLPAGTFLGLDNMKSLTVRTHNTDWSSMALELTPDSLVGMPRLESLDLGENNLKDLPERVFCPLPALLHLNLTANRLQDVSEVGVVGGCGAHLVTLDLTANDLVVLPEAGFAGLQSLRELNLQYNKISILHDRALFGLSALNILNISSNHIVALHPDAFNETTGLQELYLQNNSLSVVADTFHGLIRLVVLNLSNNRLAQVNFDMFRDLSALQVLDLSHNSLTVIGDRTFSSLANLHRLDLSYNQLLTVQGQSLAGLHVLSAISVAHNNISHISYEAFENCTNLSDLRLEYNALSEIPSAIVELISLRTLRISHNVLSTIKHDDLTHLTDLIHLDMSNNVLKGICKNCLENLSELKVLDLSSNELSAIPQVSFDSNVALQPLQSLRELYLQYNKISILHNRAFCGLSALNILNISSNLIVALPPDIFNETTGLQELYLQNNSLSVVAPGLFAALSHLTILDMSVNQLSSEWLTADTFRGLVRLVVLNLSNNRLAQVNFDMFRDMSALQVLDLSHNSLTVIGDRTFSSLANLHRLDLSYNQLLTVQGLTLAGLHVLSDISVGHNNISHISDEAFENCTNLRDLRLEYNALSEIPSAIVELISLRTLRISHNVLATIKHDDLTYLTDLIHLDMSNNVLKGICKHCLENLSELKVLDLSSNELSAIPQGSFDSNVALQHLRVDGNKLSNIYGLFASLPNLLWLNVSDNRITYFDYTFIPLQLKYLDLHENRIQDLDNYFNIEIELQTLDVSHNQLESLGPSSVPNSIELLFVNSNNITRIAPGTFSSKTNIHMVTLFDNLLSKIELNSINLPLVPENKDLPEFYIGGNPIFCDCHMEWMHRVHQISDLRQHPRVMDLDKVTCTLPYPSSEENILPFLETEPSQFLCPYTSRCFALCVCCDFIGCDCEMACPDGCSCYHDNTWAINIVDCSENSTSIV